MGGRERCVWSGFRFDCCSLWGEKWWAGRKRVKGMMQVKKLSGIVTWERRGGLYWPTLRKKKKHGKEDFSY